jgi:hypothetical protein
MRNQPEILYTADRYRGRDGDALTGDRHIEIGLDVGAAGGRGTHAGNSSPVLPGHRSRVGRLARKRRWAHDTCAG